MTARTPSNFVPFAAQSRELPVPYSCPAMKYHQTAVPLVVFHRGIVYRNRLPFVLCHATFDARQHEVLDAHIREGPARHHAVVAAPRSVTVEINGLHAVFDEVFAGGRIFLEAAGGRDVIGRHGIAKNAERAGVLDLPDLAGLH